MYDNNGGDIMHHKLKAFIEEENFSGVVTIRKDNNLLFNEAFGYRDRSNQINNDLNTKFGIASGTKLFTALGIMKLVEEKKLNLDTKLFDIVDMPYPSYNPSVTIKELLTHTSGLPDYYDEDLVDDFDTFTIATPWHLLLKPTDYLSSMPNRPMKFAPGEGFHYNNGAFVYLSVVIEIITGDFHQWIKDKIIEPLHLNNTGFYRFDQLPTNTAMGYIETKESWKTNIYNLPIIGGGDGGIYTNTDDLFKLWDGLYSNKILPASLTEILLTPHTKTNDDGYYGLGVWLDKEKGKIKSTIVGSDAGVSFYSSHNESKGLTFNVLSNTSEGTWNILKHIRAYLEDIK